MNDVITSVLEDRLVGAANASFQATLTAERGPELQARRAAKEAGSAITPPVQNMASVVTSQVVR